MCLDPLGVGPCLRSNYDIARVYSYDELYDEPLVKDGKVRLETLLHIRNFWQRHLLSSREQSFITSYASSEPKPKEWSRPLDQIELPTGCWNGYYCECPCFLLRIRSLTRVMRRRSSGL